MLHYLILAHKSPLQIHQLIKNLDGKFYIHLDKKCNIDEWKTYLKEPNIKFITKRVNVHRGARSIVECTLNGIKEIEPHMKEQDHIVILSGQDFPIKSKNYITNFFKKQINKSYIHVTSDKKRNNDLIDRIEKRYFRDLKINKYIVKICDKIGSLFADKTRLKLLRTPFIILRIERIINLILPRKKYLTNNFSVYGGSAWIALCKKHSTYILHYLNSEKGKKAIRYYKTALLPDESFFQTTLLNSKYKNEIIKECLRYIDRESGPDFPKILVDNDFEKIKNSSELFARKFDFQKSEKLINKIKLQLNKL